VSDWIVQLDPSNQVGQEHREVYAHAGVALSQAQILEHVLKEFIVITAMAKGTSETPITAEDVARPIADNEKFEAELSKHTLGQLIRTAKLYLLTARSQDLEANLIQSLNDRNRLVHHFFWDNAVELQSAHGRRKMAEELKRIQAQFTRTITDFENANKALREAIGVTEEVIERVVAAAKAGTMEEEVAAIVRQINEHRSLCRQST
jgi:hypothetical protein